MYARGADYEVCTTLETVKEFDGVYCEYGLELGTDENTFDTETDTEIFLGEDEL